MSLTFRTAVLALSLAASTALAQTRDDRALIEQGRALRRAGRNDDALFSFRAAYALRPTAEAAGQIGFAEHALERWEPAWRHLREALTEPRDPWVVAQREALEFSLRAVEARLGSLRVECAVAGATVSIAGHADTTLPMREPLRLTPGAVEIETRAPGHRSARQEVNLAAGETVRVVVQLAAEGAPTPAPEPARPVIAPTPVELPPAPSPPAPAPPAPAETLRVSNTLRHLGWVAVGGTVLFTGGAVAAMFVRDDAAARWNDDARCVGGGRTREQNCGASREQVELMHTLMIAGFSAGAVLAVSAVVAFAAAPSRRAEPSVRVGLYPGGLSLSGSF